MGTLIAGVLSMMAGMAAAGFIVSGIPNLLFRGGDEPSVFDTDKQSKLSSFLERIVVICLIPIGVVVGFLVGTKVFGFLTM